MASVYKHKQQPKKKKMYRRNKGLMQRTMLFVAQAPSKITFDNMKEGGLLRGFYIGQGAYSWVRALLLVTPLGGLCSSGGLYTRVYDSSSSSSSSTVEHR